MNIKSIQEYVKKDKVQRSAIDKLNKISKELEDIEKNYKSDKEMSFDKKLDVIGAKLKNLSPLQTIDQIKINNNSSFAPTKLIVIDRFKKN